LTIKLGLWPYLFYKIKLYIPIYLFSVLVFATYANLIWLLNQLSVNKRNITVLLSLIFFSRLVPTIAEPYRQHASYENPPTSIRSHPQRRSSGRSAPQDGGSPDADLDVDRLDLPVLSRLEVDPHHVRGHLQRRDPGPDRLAEVVADRQRRVAHFDRVQLGS